MMDKKSVCKQQYWSVTVQTLMAMDDLDLDPFIKPLKQLEAASTAASSSSNNKALHN